MKHHIMMCVRIVLSLQALDGELLASRSDCFSSKDIAPRYPLNRRLRGRVGEEKIHCLCPESNPGSPASGLVTIQTWLSRLLLFVTDILFVNNVMVVLNELMRKYSYFKHFDKIR